MRQASFESDFWQLRSAVESNRAHPDTFWIPEAAVRNSLKVGQAAKLIIEVEFQEEGGEVEIFAERMWVIVSEASEAGYVGILDNEFASFEEADDVYLAEGVEIPFLPEHVIDTANPPSDYVEPLLAKGPLKKWRGRAAQQPTSAVAALWSRFRRLLK